MTLQPWDCKDAPPHYLSATMDSVRWGRLPGAGARPVLRLDSGEVLTVDTVSHEGILDDQGRDPVAFFGRHGVAATDVLTDAIDIAAHGVRHPNDGPHVVVGPVAVSGARPGDLLAIDMLTLTPRVDYGVISTRHGRGALPDEYPPMSVFCRLTPDRTHAHLDGLGEAARIPLSPFLGIVAVAPATDNEPDSVPPSHYGGNIDLTALVTGSRLYLPVLTDDALISFGDPHYAQGNGEVCLTALEAPLRASLRISVLTGPDAQRATAGLAEPFAETVTHWIPTGMDADLDEAMRKAVRAAITFLHHRFDMPEHLAYAYLSAAADFEVTQVVDRVKGIHCKIRKHDFPTHI